MRRKRDTLIAMGRSLEDQAIRWFLGAGLAIITLAGARLGIARRKAYKKALDLLAIGTAANAAATLVAYGVARQRQLAP